MYDQKSNVTQAIKRGSNLSVNATQFSYYVSYVSGRVNQISLMWANKTNRKVQKGPQREHLWHIIQLSNRKESQCAT